MAKKIITVKIDSLTLDPNNARKHGETDIEAIAKSLDQFQHQSPIVITADNLVIKGNGTVMAAMKRGWKTIEAVQTTLTGQDLVAYGIADNRTGELSSWDNEKLMALLDGFDEQALRDAAGFNDDDLKRLAREIALEEPPPEIIEDEVPEPPKVAVTKPGDIWLLGAYYECEKCKKQFSYEDGQKLIDAGADCDCK